MNTKYTAKYGWMAAKGVLYGTLFMIMYWVLYALDNNGVYEILSIRTNDLYTWAVINALVTWVMSGVKMMFGLTLDALYALKSFVIRTVDKIDARFKKA